MENYVNIWKPSFLILSRRRRISNCEAIYRNEVISNAKHISNGEADFTFIPSVAKATAPLDSQNKGEPLFVVTTLRLEQLETISGRCRGVTEVIR